jgi:hypothetical protein
MSATNRDALIRALTECRKQLDYFAYSLEGYDEEFMTLLLSAAEILNLRSNVLRPWEDNRAARLGEQMLRLSHCERIVFQRWSLLTSGVYYANARPV